MIGREIGRALPANGSAQIGAMVLRVEEITGMAVRDVSFDASATARCWADRPRGRRPDRDRCAPSWALDQMVRSSLTATRSSPSIQTRPKSHMPHGIGFMHRGPERPRACCWRSRICREHELAHLGKVPPGRALSRGRSARVVERVRQGSSHQALRLDHECNSLSGGNQQKVVLAKWSGHRAQGGVSGRAHPRRGRGRQDEIFKLINALAATGVAVILVSSELPEVLGMSDRIMVVCEGRVTGIVDSEGADQAKIMTLATGGSIA